MSSSEAGCGDGEELGLEAAAEAGGLTSFSRPKEAAYCWLSRELAASWL